GVPPRDPVLAQLLSSATRRAAVATSPFNIAPSTDLQPYFRFNAVSLLEQMDSPIGRVLIVGGVVAAVGFILGCALPLGVRQVALTGEWAIQKMWAINDAASIAASVLAAVIGLGWGSGAVVTSGILAYGL